MSSLVRSGGDKSGKDGKDGKGGPDPKALSPMLPRTKNTGSAPPQVRRMDSLARLMHVRGSFVTAVGFDANSGKMLIAANQHPGGRDSYFDEVGRRMGVVQGFISGDVELQDAVRDLRNRDYSDKRLARDLKKLRNSALGRYSQQSGRNFSEEMTGALMSDTWLAHRGGDDVHAELDVARKMRSGVIGVSRLNCMDCHQLIQEDFGGQIQTRGTHGFAFRGWKSPYTRRNAGKPASKGFMRDHLQHPTDSGSESDVD